MQPVPIATPHDFGSASETGWTRAHWLEMFAELIAPIIDNASPGKARQIIPGQRSHHGRLADELEGFTRSFIMAGPWLATTECPEVHARRGTRNVASFYREGILAGTDPEHEEYWGDITDYAQHLVEMASLAWSLYLSRRWIWDTYSEAEKRQVADYLYQCTTVEYHQNNWLLFNVVTNAVLKRLEMPYRQDQIDENIDACEGMYLGSGWYRDGSVNRLDYYNAWAFHYYYLIWSILDGESKPEVATRHRERVALLAEQMPYFLAADGSAPIFGRSMIYRFGYLAPLVLGVSMDAVGVPAGLLRTVCNATMRFFAEQPILTDDGFLGMGYIRPNESILEHYSCGGSPYWAAKAFNALLIPASDSFWTAPEEPLPIRESSFSRRLDDAGLLLLGSRDDGQVQLLNQKSYHDHPEYNAKYTNFAYSTHFPYESRPIYGSIAPDNALQFSADGILYYQRWEMEHLGMSEFHSAARYALYEADPEGTATTTILARSGVLVLVHRVAPTKPLWFREGGFPLAWEAGTPQISAGPDWSAAEVDGRVSLIANLAGYDRVEPPRSYGLDTQGTNVRYPFSVIPQLTLRRTSMQPVVLVSLVAGHGGGVRPEQMRGTVEGVTVDDAVVTVRYADLAEARVEAATGEVSWRSGAVEPHVGDADRVRGSSRDMVDAR
ncbi:MAG: DUF2264 domain-containing protein [Spirochaetia bacterium]